MRSTRINSITIYTTRDAQPTIQDLENLTADLEKLAKKYVFIKTWHADYTTTFHNLTISKKTSNEKNE